jgi:hypothetical protein
VRHQILDPYPLTRGSSIQGSAPLLSPSAPSFSDATLVRAARGHILSESIQKFGITQCSGPYRVYAHYSPRIREGMFSETNFRQAFFSETGLSGYSAASTSLLSPHSESVEDEYDPYC